MILFLQIIFVLFFLKAAQLLLDYIYRIPPKQTNRNLEKTTNAKKTITESLTEEIISPLVLIVEPFIRLSDENAMMLKQNLDRADIKATPTEYYSKAFIIAAFCLPLPLLLFIAGAKALVPVAILLIPLVFYNFITTYKDALKKKKEQIEKGLPGFIRSVLYKLNDSNDGIVKADLISIFEDYLKVANPVFAYDISILVMEMKSKNVDTALRNFHTRVAIPEVGFLCNALIGITRGERQNETLASLARDMDVKGKENIKKELAKRPGKVYMASIPLVIVAILALAYVLVTTLMQGVATLT